MSKNILNEENLNNSIEKLIMYSDEESSQLEKIEKKLNSINDSYNGLYSERLNSSNVEFTRNFNTIIDNKKKIIRKLKTAIEKYNDSANYTKKIFQNLK